MRKLSPLNISNFRQLQESNLYIDKSLFIKQILNPYRDLINISRPPGFGTSTQLSMLQHFFSPHVNGTPTKNLFKNLAISHESVCMEQQGKSPVVFLDLKNLVATNLESTEQQLQQLIRHQFMTEHSYLLNSEKLSAYDKADLHEIITPSSDRFIRPQSSFDNLTRCLHKHYGKPAYVLIDHYDAPFYTAAQHGCYINVEDYLLGFFDITCQSNRNVERAFFVGTLGLPLGSVFHSNDRLDALDYDHLLQTNFAKSFGFSEDEVKQVLTSTENPPKLSEIKQYCGGHTVITDDVDKQIIECYNPSLVYEYLQNPQQVQQEGSAVYHLPKELNNFWFYHKSKSSDELKENIQQSRFKEPHYVNYPRSVNNLLERECDEDIKNLLLYYGFVTPIRLHALGNYMRSYNDYTNATLNVPNATAHLALMKFINSLGAIKDKKSPKINLEREQAIQAQAKMKADKKRQAEEEAVNLKNIEKQMLFQRKNMQRFSILQKQMVANQDDGQAMYMLFLDIDGVLYSHKNLSDTVMEKFTAPDPLEKVIPDIKYDRAAVSLFDQGAITQLKYLCDEILQQGKKLGIVMSSDWRRRKEIIHLRDLFSPHFFAQYIIGKTGEADNRSEEIVQWLEQNINKYSICGFLTLDDMDLARYNFFPQQHIIHCDWLFTKELCIEAVSKFQSTLEKKSVLKI